MKLKFALLCTLGLASVDAMACYTVFDRFNQVVYNAQIPPVDMSRPLHETLPLAFPGGQMVFNAGADCPREAPAKVAAAPVSKPPPLLTDRVTAAAMHVQHTILPSGVAMVSNPPTMIGSGITVMAASPMPLVVAPAVSARRLQRERVSTVITEMYNPPLTVVQQGGMVVSELR